MNDDSQYPKGAGIYKLTCIPNGKIYIGKSIGLKARLKNHKNACNKATGRYYFQHALIKYGWESFRVEILEVFEDFDKFDNDHKRLILEKESHYITLYNSTDRNVGYNTCELSTDRTGYKCSEEHKAKIGRANLGKRHSEETKEKLRNRKMSDETKEKIKASKLGSIVSDETKEKMSRTRKGFTHSEETKEKIRKAGLGVKFSEKRLENMRKAKQGFRHSEETKDKFRKRKWSEETKEKFRQTILKRKQNDSRTINEIANI